MKCLDSDRSCSANFCCGQDHACAEQMQMHLHLHGLSMSMQHGKIMLQCSIAAAVVQCCIHGSSRAALRGLRADFLHILLCCRVAVPVLQSCEAAVLAAAAHRRYSSSSMMLCPLQITQGTASCSVCAFMLLEYVAAV